MKTEACSLSDRETLLFHTPHDYHAVVVPLANSVRVLLYCRKCGRVVWHSHD